MIKIQFQVTVEQISFVLIICLFKSSIGTLSPFGDSKVSSNTDMSRSVSLSVLDSNGTETRLHTINQQTIEIRIPRDPNLLIPDMSIENVTLIDNRTFFNLHYVNITTSSAVSVSINLEMKPMNDNVSYLMIYRFDQSPQLNSSIRLIDGWTLFCSSSEICMQKRLVIIEMSSFVSFTDLINDTFYRYFINNQQTNNHRSFIFGFRQLTENELIHYCSNQSDSVSIRSPPMTNQSSRFTTNYRLRLYTSSCLYFDDQDQLWKSDGLVVRDRDFFGKFSRQQNFI